MSKKYWVKPGRAVSCGRKGVVGPNAEVKPDWINGEENADLLVSKGILTNKSPKKEKVEPKKEEKKDGK